MSKKEQNKQDFQYEILNKKLDKILDNQEILMRQGLFVLDFLIGDDEKREEIKRNLGCLFEQSLNQKRRTMQ